MADRTSSHFRSIGPFIAVALVLTLSIVKSAAVRAADSAKPDAGLEQATFAGGCFWCMQPAFEHIPGVVSTIVGYTGGDKPHPTYEEVSDGGTGHAESIQVTFDPKKVSYPHLLDVFWHNVDPTTAGREFCDVGNQYRSEIFYHGAGQEREAKESLAKLEETKPFKDPIVTQIVPATTFWPAEDYHQDYALKNPDRYRFYRYNCGRDQRLRELWGALSGGH
ncbi:MAG TPA: peptide-methionine (S)-S-oxide reductase MsrA [Candidatus Binataceae bacterium]|nr:peptide-methionine (S)-S-oxide reductase MsrA [Candidatus Binataceae bacterium]